MEDKKEGEGVHFYFNKEKRVHTKRCEQQSGTSAAFDRERYG